MATSRARLGVMVIGLTPELRTHFGAPEDRGVMIGRVEPTSAAAAAGLAVGDVLTEVKGTRVDDATDVLATLAAAKKDETVRLGVIRDRRPLTLSARMLDEPTPQPLLDGPWSSWIRDWFRSFPRDPWPMPDQSDKSST